MNGAAETAAVAKGLIESRMGEQGQGRTTRKEGRRPGNQETCPCTKDATVCARDAPDPVANADGVDTVSGDGCGTVGQGARDKRHKKVAFEHGVREIHRYD